MVEFVLSNDKNQSYRVNVDVDGKGQIFDIQVRWHEILDCWLLSIWRENGEIVAKNVPMLSGLNNETSNLLHVYDYLNAGQVFVSPQTDDAVGVDPNIETLSKDYGLLWG